MPNELLEAAREVSIAYHSFEQADEDFDELLQSRLLNEAIKRLDKAIKQVE